MSTASPSRAFHRYAIALAAVTVLLIWWGAATTTKQAGMAFADWPLSFGSINPPGWLEQMAPFLEHSHRLLATITGLMTLVLFAWSYVRTGRQWVEVAAIVVWLAVTFGLFIAGGAEREDAGQKRLLFGLAIAAGCIPVAWLFRNWKRGSWPLTAKLSALALLMVTGQAILGGVRVTEVSDTFAVIHGCLAQGFFCVVILTVLMSAPGRTRQGLEMHAAQSRAARRGSAVLVAAVLVQLILGALMRHHHRHGLADTGLWLTGGRFFPGFESEILLLMFAHKYWALVVAVQGFTLAAWLLSQRDLPVGLRRHGALIAGLLTIQIALGVSVLLTGSAEHKKFWVTNFHVLNGLAILASSFVLAVKCWSAGKRVSADEDFLLATGERGSAALPARRA
jgi:cytochrome c oxidase assembly protein subunit 15